MSEALDTIAKDMKEMKEKLTQVVHAILGDPTDQTKPYVLIRLDRLEQSDKSKTRLIWLLAAGLVTVSGEVLLTFF